MQHHVQAGGCSCSCGWLHVPLAGGGGAAGGAHLGRDGAGRAVQHFILQEYDGVGVADRRLHEAARVLRVVRRQHLRARRAPVHMHAARHGRTGSRRLQPACIRLRCPANEALGSAWRVGVCAAQGGMARAEWGARWASAAPGVARCLRAACACSGTPALRASCMHSVARQPRHTRETGLAITGRGAHAADAVATPRTFRPGTELYHAAKHCECCAATPAAAPLGPRNTMGQLICPADM